MGLAWPLQAIDGWVEDPQTSLDKALELAEQAAAIDPDIPQLHFVRVKVALFRGDHKSPIAAKGRSQYGVDRKNDQTALLVTHQAAHPG